MKKSIDYCRNNTNELFELWNSINSFDLAVY